MQQKPFSGLWSFCSKNRERNECNMKKYIALLLVTSVLLTAAGFLPGWFEQSVCTATIVTVKKGSYTETVTANGSMEYSDQIDVKTSIPFIPAEVYVQVGDQVEVGDVLAVVDKQETVEAVMSLLNLGGTELSAEVLEVFDGQSEKVSDIMNVFPETIVANAAGTVTAVSMIKGAVTVPDSALVTISDAAKLQAKVAVSETAAAKVKEGQSVTITSSALKGKEYSGTVLKIYPTARKQYSGTVQQTVVDVLVQLNETDDALKAGYSVKAEIVTQGERLFPCLPYEAVGQDETGEYVYTYQAGRAQKKYITTGIELADAIEITSGIDKDDRILNDVQKLSNNQLVRVTEIE